MDPPVVSISTERFMRIWEVFQEGANCIANGQPCSGMGMYTAVFQIVASGEAAFAVRLHWCIGKYFFALAVKLRAGIEGREWVKAYAEAFVRYEQVVELIDGVCGHLNAAVRENRECRRVRELGYVIWERIVLRQRYEQNLPALHESLPDYREWVEVCLRSLRKIVTNNGDVLEYYRNNYETGLVNRAVAEFRRRVGAYTGKDIFGHLQRCSVAIRSIVAEYRELFLPVSVSLLETELEKAIFTGKVSELRAEIDRVLQGKDREEIAALCRAVEPLEKQILAVFLDSARVFARAQWPVEFDCAAIARVYSETAELLAPTGSLKILGILEETLAQRLDRAGVGLLLSEYLAVVISRGRRVEVELFAVLLRCIPAGEEKSIFYQSYMKKLMDRLLHLRFDPMMERAAVEALQLPWALRRKVGKIFDDIVRSTKDNEVFWQSYNQTTAALPNEPFFYAIVTTACMWPVAETEMQVAAIPGSLVEMVAAFEKAYLAQHKRRKLSWASRLSWVEIELSTDKVYTVEMPVLHYALLEKIVEAPLSIDDAAAWLSVSTMQARAVLESLRGLDILSRVDETYAFNSDFSSAQTQLVVAVDDVAAKRMGNRKLYYQALITRQLKALGKCDTSKLQEIIQATHTPVFNWNPMDYNEAFQSLQERALLEVEGDLTLYLP
ncbi:cullin 2 [Nematocida homosporus]|uniref:cullin 2 n=1 Tax=Nematocida homosporus TaxID=1912981 RepID=UPI00221ECEFA|nr:cullin 2 [Nematocida homosporus]KAI5185521.1 cullin 2 [Nematocida homosporus]